MNKFDIRLLTKEQKEIRKRILEISYRKKFSHIGSCLAAVDLIDAVYKFKKKDEKFILSNGHAGIALYVVLEKNRLLKKENLETLRVHPDRNKKLNIDVSTGSLGQGLPIALGIAMADRKKNTYCMLSDGECAEGSIWEALRITKEQKIHNLKIIINFNGWAGYDKSSSLLIERFSGFGYKVRKIKGHDVKSIDAELRSASQDKQSIIFGITNSDQFSFLKGQDAHYHIMTEKDYREAISLL